MLEIAFKHKDKLQDLYAKTINNSKYKYLQFSSYNSYALKIDENSELSLQYVSINNKGEICGYLSAELNRVERIVYNICIMGFKLKSFVFSNDLKKFLEDFHINPLFYKIKWDVIVGNPSEKMYDKIVNKYNGRIVGIFKDDVLLSDGKYYDIKSYEIFTKIRHIKEELKNG